MAVPICLIFIYALRDNNSHNADQTVFQHTEIFYSHCAEITLEWSLEFNLDDFENETQRMWSIPFVCRKTIETLQYNQLKEVCC